MYLLIGILSLVAFLLHLKASKSHKFWKEKGIYYIKPLPLFGYVKTLKLLKTKTYEQLLLILYQTFPEQRYVGYYTFLKPKLLIRDPELVKSLLEDTEKFEDSPIKNLNFKDNEASKSFNTAIISNMITFSQRVEETSKNLVLHISKEENSTMNVSNASLRFINDSVAAIFGLPCDSFQENSSLFKTTKYLNQNCVFKSFMNVNCKSYSEILNNSSLKEPNLLQFTNGFPEEKLCKYFFSKCQKSSSIITCIIYELTRNEEIRENLVESIATNGNFSKLLDQIVLETLRKWPTDLENHKISLKEFTIKAKKSWEKTVSFSAGTYIVIPISGIQKDAKYYKNPEKFIPERFGSEEIENWTLTIFPFGDVKNKCLGYEIFLLIMKAFVYHLYKNFEVKPTDCKMKDRKPDNHFSIKIKRRHTKTE